jgi:hypothetical protein
LRKAEQVVNDSIDYLGEIQVNYILSTTTLEVLSYAQPLHNELKDLMYSQIDWSAPGAVNRIQPDELECVFEGAKNAVFSGFQLLSAQALVALWTELEVMIQDLFVAWLLDFPECLDHKIFQKLSIPFSVYHRLDEESRIQALYKIFVAHAPDTKSQGINRFEAILMPLGISGVVDGEIKRAIYELHLLRNLIAHQRGQVDLKFIETDFGKSYKLGDKVYIYDRQFRNYCAATMEYAYAILDRIKKYGNA